MTNSNIGLRCLSRSNSIIFQNLVSAANVNGFEERTMATLGNIVGEGKLFSRKTTIKRRGRTGRIEKLTGPLEGWGEFSTTQKNLTILKEVMQAKTEVVFHGDFECEGKIWESSVTTKILSIEIRDSNIFLEFQAVGPIYLPISENGV